MNEFNSADRRVRKYFFYGGTVLLFLVLWNGFFRIQISGSEKFSEISMNNTVRELTEYPARGVIRDTYGNILVDNRPSFMISVIPRRMTNQTLTALAELLEENKATIRKKLRGRNSFRPVIIKRDVDYTTVTRLEERRLDFPGVIVEVEPKRYYPENVFSPHIFGYVGEVSRAETRGGKKFEAGEMIGKSGLEYTYDTNLRGMKGTRFVRVDAEGRELGPLSEERDTQAEPGLDLYLTLDYNIQQFAESLMVGKRGAIVALNANTGGLITFVSKPDFDPRNLSGKISREVWDALQNDPGHPLYNRITQSVYPPGSTFKLVAVAAALQEKIITPDWSVYCPGYFKLGRKTIKCWNQKGHGKISLLEAIKGSCNVYFYQLGLKIGLETWAKYSKMFFFGKPTGIDLPNEKGGLVPTVEYFNKRYGKNGWTKGNLANLAIGQGELLVTPLQMAQLAMILANKGIVHVPHLADYLYDNKNQRRFKFPVQTKYVQGISEEVYNVIREGMRRVVDGGTGWRGGVYGIPVAGKTGTAQNPHGDDHAWFIGFAPYDNPALAIAVIIENAGGGGANAAPLASLVMEKYFYKRLLPRIVPKKDTTETVPDFQMPPPFVPDSIPRMEVILGTN